MTKVSQSLAEMDAMVSKGQIVDAIERFFAPEATTQDFDGTRTTNKSSAVEKLSGFVGSISQVNEITLHRSVANGNVSMSEFTFDFNMKDGSKIHWHEIIKRTWKEGKVVDEGYFKN